MGNRIAVPLCGIDESMIGFSLNGWEIKKLDPASDSNTILDEIDDASLYKQVRFFLDTEDIISILPFTIELKRPFYLMLVKETDRISEIEPIIDVLRVIKSSCFGCWCPLTYKTNNIFPVEKGRSFTSNALENREFLSLTENERANVISLLQMRTKEQYPSVVNTMLSFFHESCRLTNMYLSFVTRITILEMLIEGNAELSFRLKHHIAVLLGRDKEESIIVANNFKKAYNARSKFLHEGDANIVTDELKVIAYEYARQAIRNLLFANADIKTIRTVLEQAGYGDNPYQATF